MEKITFKTKQNAISLEDLISNLDISLNIDRAFLSNVTLTKNTSYKMLVIIGVLVIIGSAFFDKIIEAITGNILEDVFVSKRLMVLLIFCTIIYFVYLYIKNQKPKSDVVFIANDDIYVLKCLSQTHNKKTFKEAYKFSIDDIESIKEYPTNFLSSRFMLKLDKKEILFFEQNNFWKKDFFIGSKGVKQVSFFDVIMKYVPKAKKANEFSKISANIFLIIQAIIPYAAIFMMISIENNIRNSLNNTIESSNNTVEGKSNSSNKSEFNSEYEDRILLGIDKSITFNRIGPVKLGMPINEAKKIFANAFTYSVEYDEGDNHFLPSYLIFK